MRVKIGKIVPRLPVAVVPVEPVGQRHLEAPGQPVSPAVDPQMVGGGGERVGGGAPDVLAAVAVGIHRIFQEAGGQELRLAHGACPGADKPLPGDMPLLEDLQRGDELTPVEIAAHLPEGEARGRAQHVGRAHPGAEVRFHAPDAGDNPALDTEIGLDPAEGPARAGGGSLAGGDATRGDGVVHIVPRRPAELALPAAGPRRPGSKVRPWIAAEKVASETPARASGRSEARKAWKSPDCAEEGDAARAGGSGDQAAAGERSGIRHGAEL